METDCDYGFEQLGCLDYYYRAKRANVLRERCGIYGHN